VFHASTFPELELFLYC